MANISKSQKPLKQLKFFYVWFRQVAEDNYKALLSFFAKFPNFTRNDFYIFGESYGGIYVPTLSLRVVTGTAKLKFKVSCLKSFELSKLSRSSLCVCTVGLSLLQMSDLLGKGTYAGVCKSVLLVFS